MFRNPVRTPTGEYSDKYTQTSRRRICILPENKAFHWLFRSNIVEKSYTWTGEITIHQIFEIFVVQRKIAGNGKKERVIVILTAVLNSFWR